MAEDIDQERKYCAVIVVGDEAIFYEATQKGNENYARALREARRDHPGQVSDLLVGDSRSPSELLNTLAQMGTVFEQEGSSKMANEEERIYSGILQIGDKTPGIYEGTQEGVRDHLIDYIAAGRNHGRDNVSSASSHSGDLKNPSELVVILEERKEAIAERTKKPRGERN
jgi:hypothetical protein